MIFSAKVVIRSYSHIDVFKLVVVMVVRDYLVQSLRLDLS